MLEILGVFFKILEYFHVSNKISWGDNPQPNTKCIYSSYKLNYLAEGNVRQYSFIIFYMKRSFLVWNYPLGVLRQCPRSLFQFCSIWNFAFHTTDVQPLYLHFLFADLHRFPLKREMMPLDFQWLAHGWCTKHISEWVNEWTKQLLHPPKNKKRRGRLFLS